MKHIKVKLAGDTHRTVVGNGVLDFKDEGENAAGLSFGKLTLRSTGAPVYPDGRWGTKRDAKRIATAWGAELFEY